MDHHYTVDVDWVGNRGEGTTGYRSYGRDVVVRAEGKAELAGSADVPFRGSPDRWNPEELLVAALAQCHLLPTPATRDGARRTSFPELPGGS